VKFGGFLGSAIGASRQFPWGLAHDPSPNPQQPFAAGNVSSTKIGDIDLLLGKPPEVTEARYAINTESHG
jgi:hypothetical protein